MGLDETKDSALTGTWRVSQRKSYFIKSALCIVIMSLTKHHSQFRIGEI